MLPSRIDCRNRIRCTKAESYKERLFFVSRSCWDHTDRIEVQGWVLLAGADWSTGCSRSPAASVLGCWSIRKTIAFATFAVGRCARWCNPASVVEHRYHSLRSIPWLPSAVPCWGKRGQPIAMQRQLLHRPRGLASQPRRKPWHPARFARIENSPSSKRGAIASIAKQP